MKKPLSRVLPIPVESDIAEMIISASEKTGLVKADIMRQGLRFGVPLVVARMDAPAQRQKPSCLEYLDDYTASPVTASRAKDYLKEKLAKKHDLHR